MNQVAGDVILNAHLLAALVDDGGGSGQVLKLLLNGDQPVFNLLLKLASAR